jgi:hypothetical protein
MNSNWIYTTTGEDKEKALKALKLAKQQEKEKQLCQKK